MAKSSLFFLVGLLGSLTLLTSACDRPGEVVETTTVAEGGDSSAQTFTLEYLDLDLPERHYAVFRQELALRDINGFIAIESDSLLRKSKRAGLTGTGPLSVLTYVWDTDQGYGDMAVALPVTADAQLAPYATITLPAGPALAIEFAGPYDRLSAYHVALGQELNKRGLSPLAPSIEEYIVGPADTRDAAQFRTRIIYPYKAAQ